MGRIKELDGIRGIAIILVLLWHYIENQSLSEHNSLLDHISRPMRIGWSGVDLFFVLSGFLIVTILLEARGASRYFTTFYVRRACRILPLYLTLVGLFIVLKGTLPIDWLFADPLPVWSYVTLTQNFFMHSNGFGPNWLAVTWSLAVEEQFYLLIPLLVWKLNKKQLFFLFAALVCLAPIFRLLSGNLGAYVFPFARSDSIFIGGLIAILFQSHRAKEYLANHHNYLLAALLIFLFGTVILAYHLPDIGNIFNHLWLGIFYGLAITTSLTQIILGRGSWATNGVLVWMGLRSYAIYLFHQPITGLVHYYLNNHAPPHFSDWGQFSLTALSLLITFALAELSYRYFERAFLSYGKRYTYNDGRTVFFQGLKPIKINDEKEVSCS